MYIYVCVCVVHVKVHLLSTWPFWLYFELHDLTTGILYLYAYNVLLPMLSISGTISKVWLEFVMTLISSN